MSCLKETITVMTSSWAELYSISFSFSFWTTKMLWLLTLLRCSPEQRRGRHLIFLFLSRACSRWHPSHSFSLSFLSASRWSLTSLLVARPRRSSGPCYGRRGRRRVCCQALHTASGGERNGWRVHWKQLWRVGVLISTERKFQLSDTRSCKSKTKNFPRCRDLKTEHSDGNKKALSAHLKGFHAYAPSAPCGTSWPEGLLSTLTSFP